MMPYLRFPILILLLAGWLGGTGCASGQAGGEGWSGDRNQESLLKVASRSETVSAASDSEAIVELPRPVPAFGVGLQVHRFVITDPENRAGPILERFRHSPSPLTPDQIALLQANGLRVVAVPVSRLDELVSQWPADPVRESTWMGTVTEWTAIAASSRVTGTRLVRMDGEPMTFSEGRFRLLVRAYPFPTEDGLLLRLEWLGQFHQPVRNPLLPDRRAENLMGSLMASLGALVDLNGELALVLISESPNVDWAVPLADPVAGNQNEVGGEDERDDAANGSHALTPPRHQPGPDVQLIRTTAEEILESGDGIHQVILILVPSLGRINGF